MLRILVDNGIVSAADFLEGAVQPQVLRWGDHHVTSQISGFQRVPLKSDPDIQAQADALFTIGRLAREGQLELYTYNELMAEQWRRNKGRDHAGNAFRGCVWNRCEAPVERSSFFRGLSMKGVTAKGGRKDRKAGTVEWGNQIEFFRFLLELSPEHVEQLIAIGPPVVKNEFEKESLRDLEWFRNAGSVAPSPENLPDFFHLWTARRNAMNVFLTLEKTLPGWRGELTRKGLLGSLSIMRPTELAQRFGVQELDPVPFESCRFYSFGELMGRPFDGWRK